MSDIQEKLGSDEWVAQHIVALREVFPETYTKADADLFLRLGFKLKLLGVEWNQLEEMGVAMHLLLTKHVFKVKHVGGDAWVIRNVAPVTRGEWTHVACAQIDAARICREEPPEIVKDAAKHHLDRIMQIGKDK